MGLSSSQARLLNLTSRMHQIEYKAAKLEAEKLRMANKSRRVYLEYQNALEQTKLQVSEIQSDGSIDFIDATYNNLKARGYDLRFDGDDKVLITPEQEQHYLAALEEGGKEYFAALETRGNPEENGYNINGIQEVFTASQLVAALGNNANVRLMADIDMSNAGNYTSTGVSGLTLDGNGHSITGLKTALFTNLKNSSVSNLNISGNIEANDSGGILATNASGSNISNINVSGSILSTRGEAIGGLIGWANNNTTISNCATTANVTSTGKCTGGLIGSLYQSKINNCSANCSVTGSNTTGGLIGYSTNSSTINNSSANCNIVTHPNEATGFYGSAAGCFAGSISGTQVNNCSAEGNVYCSGSQAGGFTGTTNSGTRISNCNSNANITVEACNVTTGRSYLTGGFVGEGIYSTFENCNAAGSVTVINPNICTYGGFIGDNTQGSASPGNRVGDTTIINCYTSIEGTNSNHPFYAAMTSQDSLNGDLESAPSPSNNVIKVTPPTVNTNTRVDNDEAKELWDDIQENGYTLIKDNNNPFAGHEDDNRWLTNMVNEGYLFIYKKDTTTKKYYQVSVSTDTNLQEVDDEKELRKAEAKYEADMRQIDMKDRKFDYDLAALDAERNAIKSEMETLKTVAKDNVDRTFKLFG